MEDCFKCIHTCLQAISTCLITFILYQYLQYSFVPLITAIELLYNLDYKLQLSD